MISFITKSKVLDYIQQYPDARIPLLAWIKEFPYKTGINILDRNTQGCLQGQAQLGNTDYRIKFRINIQLKTGYIEWFGTKQELKDYEHQKFAELQARYPDEKLVTTEVRVTVQARVPVKLQVGPDGSKTVEILESPPQPLKIKEKLLPVFNGSDEQSGSDFKTTIDYEQALDRAIAIFDASPETPDFDELVLLLPLIKNYEHRNFELPPIADLDIVKLKVNEREMGYPYSITTIRAIGSAEEIDLFLAGKKNVTAKKLKKIYNFLKIDYLLFE